MNSFYPSLILSLILLLCSNNKANAQEYEIVLTCPDTVGTEQQFKISYKISANVEKFETKTKTPFSIKGADVLYGPSQNNSSSAKFINGNITKSYSVEQTYIISSAYSPQDITVEPMRFDVLQENDVAVHLSTDRKVIKVIKGYIPPKDTNMHDETKEEETDSLVDTSFIPKKIKSVEDIAPDDVVFKWTTDRSEIDLGDTVSCNCDLYTRLQPTQLSSISDKLIDDCIILEDTLTDMTLERVEYEGRECYHVRVQSFRIIPLHTGKISIGGNTFALEMTNVDALDFFFGKAEHISYESESNQTYIKVKGKMYEDNEPLPYGNDCFLLCDISTSMTGNDIEPSRMSCVQDFTNKWLKLVPITEIISFAGGVEQYCAANQNIETFSFISEPKVDGTAIGNAMIAPISCGAKVKDLIIITDGANNRGYISLKTAFDIINEYDVRVSYIYLNSGNDSIDFVLKGFDVKTKNEQLSESELSAIKKMVQSTGGLFGRARNKSELLNYLPKLKTLVDSEKRKSRNRHVVDDKILGRFLNIYKDEVLQNTDK